MISQRFNELPGITCNDRVSYVYSFKAQKIYIVCDWKSISMGSNIQSSFLFFFFFWNKDDSFWYSISRNCFRDVSAICNRLDRIILPFSKFSNIIVINCANIVKNVLFDVPTFQYLRTIPLQILNVSRFYKVPSSINLHVIHKER